MNHNQQENRTGPRAGGKPRRPENVPSKLEEQATREQQAHPQRSAHEREARRASEEHGTTRKPATNTDKFGKDMPREQQAEGARPNDAGWDRDRNNPARQSDSGPRQNDVRGDLPGQT